MNDRTKNRAEITWDAVTPESVEDGDTADHGYWAPGNWHDPLEACKGVGYELPLRDGIKHALDLGCYQLSVDVCGDGVQIRMYSERETRLDGNDYGYCLHILASTRLRAQLIVDYLASKGVSTFGILPVYTIGLS